MTELALFARITPKPEHRTRALAALEGILAPTRAEPGCLRFELNTGDGDDPSLYLVEQWRDAAALETHYAQPYVAEVFAAYADWLAKPVETVPMRPHA
ncbi:putative quinol monooxygenase [Jannaschia marina]|uniref:putative quinol monooxygenase n=1 Tax=Jannaschia marina TaxID=2741674 RepID=UPI0015CA65C0|nr:putative quinol monooxygenase [Jannaschia marina]